MNRLPKEVIEYVYEFEGNQFFKPRFKSCLAFIDVKRHPERAQNLVKDHSDIIPYRRLRSNYYASYKIFKPISLGRYQEPHRTR